MKKILQIEQLKSFKCTGASCVDHCCHSWRVTLSKETYKKYKKTPSIGAHNIAVVNENSGPNYGKIILKEDGNCPFMQSSGLCNIHATLGVNHLSDTCQHYPRKNNLFADRVEKGFSLGCPEIVKLVIGSEAPISFDLTVDIHSSTHMANNTKDAFTVTGLSKEGCFNLRSAVITILQDDNMDTKEKMILAGNLCLVIHKLIENDNTPEEISAFIMELENSYKTDEILNFTIDTIINDENKYSLISKLMKLAKELVPADGCKHTGDFRALVESNLSSTDEVPLERVENFTKNVLDPYFKENHKVIENYMVTKLFTEVFPKEADSVEESIRLTFGKVAVFKALLVALYNDKSKLCQDDIVNAIYFMERKIEHSTFKPQLLAGVLNNLGLHWMDIINLVV